MSTLLRWLLCTTFFSELTWLMQKPVAANSKAATILISHMSDKLLKKFKIKWIILIITSIKWQTRYYLWKQISQNIIGYFFILAPKAQFLCILRGSVVLTDTGDDGGEFSLSSFSSYTRGFSTDPPMDTPLNVVGENGVSMPGPNTASMSNCQFPQLNSMSLRWDTW